MRRKTGYLLTKVCESCCPKCGAGQDEIEWGDVEFDEVSSLKGTCKQCGCNFREFYEYSNTEWYEGDKKTIKSIRHTVEIPVGEETIKIRLWGQDGRGNWNNGKMFSPIQEQGRRERYDCMIEGIQSFLLSLAITNIDVTNSAILSALESVIDVLRNTECPEIKK